jgi:hypothetical protein
MNITALSPRLAAAAALAAGVMLAGPAHADPDTNTDDTNTDEAFLASLKQSGLTYGSSARAVAAGQTVCGLMDNGKSGIEVITYVQKNNPGVTLDDAAKFVAIAANQYCPKRLGL